MSAPAEMPGEIVTERLVLRPIREEDAEGVIAAIEASRAELRPWMAWEPAMRTVEDVHELRRRQAANRVAGTDFGLGIFARETGRYLGGTGFHDVDWRVPKMSTGYWLRTSETGKGYVREAVTALARVGFGRFGLRRLEITCASTNLRSRRVPEAVGFRLEGTLRNDDRLPDGSLRDTLV